MSESAAQVRCGRVVDPDATYPHPCVLPEGHDGPCDPRPPEMRSAATKLPPTMGVTAMAAMLAPPVARPPVKCPVCFGKTTMPSGFYVDDSTTSAAAVKCRSCGGRGIV